jgi:FOG: HEAT repeat
MFLSQYPTSTAVATLIHMLDDESAEARFAAKDALMRLGAWATPAIAMRLADTDERHAVVLLEIACAAPSHEYTAAAAVLRGDASGSVRRLVARLFRGMGGEFATTQLTEMLKDADAAVREAAVEALGFLNHWSSSPLVAARLEDGSSRVRLAAALALDRFGAPGELFLRRAVIRGSEVAQAAARRIIDDQSRLALRVAASARE